MGEDSPVVYPQQLVQQLTFDELHTVRMIANTGSFSEASRLLYVTQPAISRRIRQVERMLGGRIFDRRSGIGVTVTPLGERLVDFCEESLRCLDQFTAELATMRSPTQQSELGIVAPSDTMEYILTPALVELGHRSEYTFRLYQAADREQVVRMVSSGKADLAFDRLPTSSSLEAIARVNEDLHLVAPPGHELLDFPVPRRAEKLHLYPFVAYAPGMRSGDLVQRWLAKVGGMILPRAEPRNPAVMKKLVLELEAISVLPASVVAEELEAGSLVIVEMGDMPLTRSTTIAVRRTERRAEVTKFVDEFVSLCGRTDAASLSCLDVLRV